MCDNRSIDGWQFVYGAEKSLKQINETAEDDTKTDVPPEIPTASAAWPKFKEVDVGKNRWTGVGSNEYTRTTS